MNEEQFAQEDEIFRMKARLSSSGSANVSISFLKSVSDKERRNIQSLELARVTQHLEEKGWLRKEIPEHLENLAALRAHWDTLLTDGRIKFEEKENSSSIRIQSVDDMLTTRNFGYK